MGERDCEGLRVYVAHAEAVGDAAAVPVWTLLEAVEVEQGDWEGDREAVGHMVTVVLVVLEPEAQEERLGEMLWEGVAVFMGEVEGQAVVVMDAVVEAEKLGLTEGLLL